MAKTVSGVAVRKTPMGKGLFATQGYRKNQTIGEMTGVIISDDNYDPDYVVDLGKLGVLEPHPPFRFLNHSCEPNAALIEYEGDAEELPTMWVEALRAIRPGDQVTIDYAWPADAAIPCLCGAKACRGWVVGAAELAKLKRRLTKAAKPKAAKPKATSVGKSPPPKRSKSKSAPR